MRNLILSFFLVCQCIGFSQTPLNPVTWTARYADLPNGEGEITFTANIENKWHIYSQRLTDVGPVPTSFSITPGDGFKVVGKVEESNAHEEYVKAFEAKIFVFEKEAIFKQRIKRISKASFIVKVTLEYMTCNNMQCLPPKTVELNVTVPSVKLKGKL